VIAKSWHQRTSPLRTESFHPIIISHEAPMGGTNENFEKLLGAIFFIREQSTFGSSFLHKRKTEQPLSSILALTSFFLSSLFIPLAF
jgi:hypothetical protein